MSVGKRIRRYRLQKGLSQEDLVREISSIAYLSRIENERIKPSASFVNAIAERLDIDSSYLVGDSSEAQLERIKEIVAKYNKSSQLSEQDVSLLEFNALEPHEPHILISIYRVLLGFYLRKKEIKEAERIYSLSKTIVPQTIDQQYYNELFFFYMNCGTFRYFKQDFYAADHYYSKAEKLMPPSQSKQFADLYYNLSLTKQWIMSDKSLCIHYSDKAYDIYKDLGYEYKAVQTLIQKGAQSHTVGNYDQSLLYLQEALDYMLNQNDLGMVAMIESNIGRVFQGLKQYDRAIEHFNRSLEIKEQIGQEHQKIFPYRSLIQISIETNHLSMVEKYYEEVHKILNQMDYPYLRQEVNAIYARVYKMKKEDAIYERELKKVIDNCISDKRMVLVSKLCYELGSHYYEKHNYKKAAYYFKKSMDFERG